jgi:quinol monooxygenase YgiN
MASQSFRVVARIVAKPESIREVQDILLGFVAPTRAEQGCVTYELLQNREDPTDFTFVEEWTDDPSFEAHHKSPHITAGFPKLQSLVAQSPDIRTYRLLR